jgi:membrane-associated phospholipid phosphatase
MNIFKIIRWGDDKQYSLITGGLIYSLMMKKYFIIILIICTCTFSYGQLHLIPNNQTNSSFGDPDSINSVSPYDLDLERELFLLGGGVLLNITGAIIVDNISPLTLQEINELDVNDINSFDKNAIKPYRESLNGDYLLYVSFLLPLTFLANDNTRRDWQMLGVMWLEVMAIQSGINLLTKSLAKRTRPYVYDPNTLLEKKQTVNARLSFYSGHTSTTAATTFYIARVFSDYLSNKTVKTLIWIGAAIYPALTGYLRRDTGNHFRTDVITGYLIGAAIGYFIPEIHLRNEALTVSIYKNFYNESVNISLNYSF